MTDNKQKVLICGDIRGSYKQFFTKIDSTNKKAGPFDLVLCAGSFFSDTNNDELVAYKNGFKHVSCPTYILGPTTEASNAFFSTLDMNDDEICQNLSYLGKRGLYTTSSGLRIAYLSGTEAKSDETETPAWQFTKKDVIAVRDSCLASKSSGEYRGVDVLITAQEPKLGENEGSVLISWLALQIKPRYHFCSMSETYNERPPYRTPRDQTTSIDLSTRLITLASVTNATKAKYLYAANIQPVEKMRVIDLLQKTTDETECPYLKLQFNVETSSGINKNQEQNQFFYDMNDPQDFHGKRRHGGNNHGHQKRPRQQQFDQEKCWFCLSSPDVEKHLVITVGENFYMAMPKGPINENHVLLLSVNHIQSSALLSNESWEELLRFKDALRKFYASIGQVVCFFERNYRTSHLLIDCIPLPKTLEWQIKLTINDKSDEYNLQMETVPNLMDPTDLPDHGPYFSIELPDDSVMLTRQMKNFPIQLTREIMCAETLLNDESKIDWRECKLSKDEELEYVKQFRLKFGHFDFNLDEFKE
ncbi:CWF19-like protein 1 homolog [Culicoides brevitarsis]|uniref:CWF19-like protein 1 homolog n=1 Tax=Culicoides brevitarsis TaxID=469753 RepID=UPI00307B8C00